MLVIDIDNQEVLYQCDVAHRNQNSFPTRRSSDLPRLEAERERGRRVARRVRHRRRRLRRGDALRHGPGHHRAGERSEEHTSELQSRRELVCRLLLEKKKLTILDFTESYTESRMWF